jgi:hypothetical protein
LKWRKNNTTLFISVLKFLSSIAENHMHIYTAAITTKELQQALRDYCAANGGIPTLVIIQSYEKQIRVDLRPGGMVSSDEFQHAATGA